MFDSTCFFSFFMHFAYNFICDVNTCSGLELVQICMTSISSSESKNVFREFTNLDNTYAQVKRAIPRRDPRKKVK